MNYIENDITNLIKDAYKSAQLLNSEIFDDVNWLELSCKKGGRGEFSSVEWIHFNNIERHLSNIISPTTKIFRNVSDISTSKVLPFNETDIIKEFANIALQKLQTAMSRVRSISQTAADIDRFNKRFYASNEPFIKEKNKDNYIKYSRTQYLYPVLRNEKILHNMLQKTI